MGSIGSKCGGPAGHAQVVAGSERKKETAMLQDAANRAAASLRDARSSGRAIKALAEDCRPATVDDGYQIQTAFRQLWTDRLAGWKIGATAAPVMAKFGVTEPFCGPIYAADVYASPARLDAARFNHYVIETEFAYRLGRDLPARAASYSREEIVEAVDAVLPAFEMINCRYEALPLDNASAAIADCGLNGALVLGPAVTDWRNIDVPRHAVRLLVDGAVKGEGTGASALGDPRKVLEWVINKLSRDGVSLSKGQVLSTGTCTGVVKLEPGQVAVGDFGTLGKIEVRFA
jgi:2-keto-4-pentenoate hydratase